jgi:hypothetical protein
LGKKGRRLGHEEWACAISVQPIHRLRRGHESLLNICYRGITIRGTGLGSHFKKTGPRMETMRHLPSGVIVLALFAFLAVAPNSYAAAQLKAGAKTSAQPTSTNPSLRQIQITFDPSISPGIVVDNGYDVDAFQLSVSYPANLMTVSDVELVNPFINGGNAAGPGASPATTPETGYVNDPVGGTISDISGVTPTNTAAGPGDVNIFYVDFTLDPGVSFDQELDFSLYANAANGDYISGYDPSTLSSTSTGADGIQSASVATTFNEAPEPACLAFASLVLISLCRRHRE